MVQKESSPTATSGYNHMNYDRTAVTSTDLPTSVLPLTGLEHPTVDVLWRPEAAVYQHNNVISQQVKSIAGVQLGSILQ